MIVTILDNKWEYENTSNAIEKISHNMDEVLVSNDQYFSHMVIDGVGVYEQWEEYVRERLEQVLYIEVKVKSSVEFAYEILISVEAYLHRAITELPALTDGFYGKPKESDWRSFNQLLEGFQWIFQAFQTISQAQFTLSNEMEIGEISKDLHNHIRALSEAVTNQDNTLIGDILLYELTPSLQGLQSMITKSINLEVV